jgi:hypothetical protein
MNHARRKILQERKISEGYTEPENVSEARRKIRLSMALAEAVYMRRTELGPPASISSATTPTRPHRKSSSKTPGAQLPSAVPLSLRVERGGCMRR